MRLILIRHGESQHTVRGMLGTLATKCRGDKVVAVTHAGFIVIAFVTLFAIPRPGTGARIDPDFTSVTEWEHDDATSSWRLIHFNDIAHLRHRTR